MTNPDANHQHTTGDAKTALSWIESSDLPAEQKAALTTFVNRFPTLTFTREDDATLDRIEKAADITLPAWFRNVHRTLAQIEPKVFVRVDDFDQYASPRAEDTSDIWYSIGLGYTDGEQRELLYDKAQVYPIGGWIGTDESCLAIDLKDPSNMQILEYAYEDLMDNDFDGRPIRGSIRPAFNSYAQFLGHVVAVKLPDGTEIEAEE